MALLPWSSSIDDFFDSNNHWKWHNFNRNFHYRELDTLVPSWSVFRHRVPRLFSELHNIFDNDATEKSSFDENGFHVSVVVKDFHPNEISVKTVDNTLVIEANHEEHKKERGYISRRFKRQYAIPGEFNVQNINTQLSSDGILTIKVPRDRLTGNVREVKIKKTGPARLFSGSIGRM